MVTLIHPGPSLLELQPAKVGKYAHAWLLQHGCTVLLQDRVVSDAASLEVETKKGQKVSADLVLWCTGNKKNSGFLGAEVLDGQGQVKVRFAGTTMILID